MIYILLGIMIYFSITLKIRATTFFIVLVLILILNEVYNYGNYNRKDPFSEYHEKYKFDRELNPYEYARPEFRSAIVPNVFGENTHLRDGISCAAQKTILDEKLKSKKLDYQDAYTEKLMHTIFPPENSGGDGLEKLVRGDPIDLNEATGIDPNVFNPIYESEFATHKKCPTVCHLITDMNKCRSAQDIPTFESEADYNSSDYKKKVENCALINNNRDRCAQENYCSFDEVFEKCYYDKRKCLAHQDIDNNIECHTRCEYMNVEGNLRESKMRCDSAKLYNGDNYCNWHPLLKQCVPKCELYSRETECNKSPNCQFVPGTGCRNK